MRNGGVVFILGVAALCGPAFAGDLRQFDLICKGTTRTVTGPKAPEEWAWHMSLDLDANRWCGHAHACNDLYKIANTGPDVIQIAHRQTYYDFFAISFAPRTGRLAWSYDYNASMTYLSEGTCETAPFTAFPIASRMSEETGPEMEPPPGEKRGQNSN